MIIRKVLFCIVFFILTLSFVRADVITDWNQISIDSIKREKLVATGASRCLAMVHAAMFDAVNAVDKSYMPYLMALDAPEGTSPETAAAVAGHGVLSAMFPSQTDVLDDALDNSLKNIPDGQAKTAGIVLGTAAADIVISWRSYDHSSDMVMYTPGTAAGQWRPTPPMFAPPMAPQWATVRPFGMKKSSQFRLSRPPSLKSNTYKKAWTEVKNLGARNSALRTAEQTAIAQFWADMPGTETTVGRWNLVARSVSGGNSLIQNARLFALLNIAMADAGIAAWDNKYSYNFWRPITAIREADTDGNKSTDPDSSWESLLNTPAFPEYVSAHSTFSAAAAEVLAKVFGANNKSFEISGYMGNSEKRTYTSFTAAAKEAGRSRIYGGIHFNFSDNLAQKTGKKIGSYIWGKYMKKSKDFWQKRALQGIVNNQSNQQLIMPNTVTVEEFPIETFIYAGSVQ